LTEPGCALAAFSARPSGSRRFRQGACAAGFWVGCSHPCKWSPRECVVSETTPHRAIDLMARTSPHLSAAATPVRCRHRRSTETRSVRAFLGRCENFSIGWLSCSIFFISSGRRPLDWTGPRVMLKPAESTPSTGQNGVHSEPFIASSMAAHGRPTTPCLAGEISHLRRLATSHAPRQVD